LLVNEWQSTFKYYKPVPLLVGQLGEGREQGRKGEGNGRGSDTRFVCLIFFMNLFYMGARF
jgi:hypothetical protein